MIKDLLFIGAGGFVGSILRYLISLAFKGSGNGFPWGTLTVNILGCFLIGMFYGLSCRYSNLSSHLVLFLTVGLCGGFTTFSTFSKEALAMLQYGNYWAFAIYIIGSVVVGLGATALGIYLTR